MTSQNSSDLLFLDNSCMFSKKGLYITFSFTVVWTVLLFPLYSLVLRIGFQRWRQNRRYTVSHTDFFTYHSIFFELLMYIGYIILSYAALQSDYYLFMCGVKILTFASLGVVSPHVLTCVERYLAVVHPVVYLNLRTQQWIWARHLIVLVIWLICPLWVILMHFIEPQRHHIPVLTLLGTVTGIIAFCSVEVLRTLKTPGPGEGKGVSKSKQRAFYTILTILSVLMLWLSGAIVCSVLEEMNVFESDFLCMLQKSMCLMQLPTTLVLPLLFLHRAGKLPF